MSDVSELIQRCKQPLSMSMFLRVKDLAQQALTDRAELADALETLAAENARLSVIKAPAHHKDCGWHLDQYPWECTCGHARAEAAQSRLAKLAPAVEAARNLTSGAEYDTFDPDLWFRLVEALATLEAADD